LSGIAEVEWEKLEEQIDQVTQELAEAAG